MARNLSGLNGRNIMFWKLCRPIKAYIVKYTKEGKYYALSKSNGNLYEFTQTTCYDTDGASGEHISIKRVNYDILEKYNIHITSDNWKEYIDFQSKNIRMSIDDILDMIRDILRISSLLLLFGGGFAFRILSSYGIEIDFGIIGIPASLTGVISLFVGSYHYLSIDNHRRSLYSRYEPKDKIHYL